MDILTFQSAYTDICPLLLLSSDLLLELTTIPLIRYVNSKTKFRV